MPEDIIPVEAWNWLERDFLYAGKKRVGETWAVREETDHLTLWMVEAGRVEVESGSRRITVRSGEGILLLPGSFQRIFSEDNRIFSTRLRWQWPTGRPLFSSATPCLFKLWEEEALTERTRALVRFLDERAERRVMARQDWPRFRVLPYDLEVKGWFSWQESVMNLERHLVGLLLRRGYRPELMRIKDERVLEALTRIQRHPLAAPLTAEELAADLGLSRGRLNSLFREQTGTTPARILRIRRRRRVRERLERSSTPIKQIAFESGFSSLPQFSDWCRRAFGSSPREVRRQANPY